MVWQDPVVQQLCEAHEETDPEALVLRLCRDLLAFAPTEDGPSPLRVLGSVQLIRECKIGQIPTGAGCSGLLVPIDGGYNVILNADEPQERQHFSLAHEIVHTFFRKVCPDITEPSDEEEKLCDIGAAELAMPRERFSRYMNGNLLSFQLIEELRAEFGVSFDASARRTVRLSDEAACFFVASLARTRAQELANRGEPVLRITSWSASSSWPESTKYKNQPVSEESLLAGCFSNLGSRIGSGPLGIPFSSTDYDLEVRAYEYPRGDVTNHRQAVALAKLSKSP